MNIGDSIQVMTDAISVVKNNGKDTSSSVNSTSSLDFHINLNFKLSDIERTIKSCCYCLWFNHFLMELLLFHQNL